MFFRRELSDLVRSVRSSTKLFGGLRSPCRDLWARARISTVGSLLESLGVRPYSTVFDDPEFPHGIPSVGNQTAKKSALRPRVCNHPLEVS